MSEIVRVKIPFMRETKGSILYQDSHNGEAVQNIYIKKEAFPKRDYPANVTVTVTIDD
jgi:hypothetical protein